MSQRRREEVRLPRAHAAGDDEATRRPIAPPLLRQRPGHAEGLLQRGGLLLVVTLGAEGPEAARRVVGGDSHLGEGRHPLCEQPAHARRERLVALHPDLLAELDLPRGVDEPASPAVCTARAAAAHPRRRPCAPSLAVARTGLDLGLDPVAVTTALGAGGGGGEGFHVVVHPQSRRPQVRGDMPRSLRGRGAGSCTISKRRMCKRSARSAITHTLAHKKPTGFRHHRRVPPRARRCCALSRPRSPRPLPDGTRGVSGAPHPRGRSSACARRRATAHVQPPAAGPPARTTVQGAHGPRDRAPARALAPRQRELPPARRRSR